MVNALSDDYVRRSVWVLVLCVVPMVVVLLSGKTWAQESETAKSQGLDLSSYELRLVYETDFSEPLNVIREDELFEGDERVRLPEGKDWVFEGPGQPWTEDGKLHLANKGGHLVLWNTRELPGNFLLEFGFSPKNSEKGLAIVFFCARARHGGSIFDLGLPKRGGIFRNYTMGAINCYHLSYWAVLAEGTPREHSNLRKDHGFNLVAQGDNPIVGQGEGPHRIRLLKVDGKIQLETNNKLALEWEDDGESYGPVWAEGCIGLRQMARTELARYTHFKVWQVTSKE